MNWSGGLCTKVDLIKAIGFIGGHGHVLHQHPVAIAPGSVTAAVVTGLFSKAGRRDDFLPQINCSPCLSAVEAEVVYST